MFKGAELLAIDIETKDPLLKTKGVGVRRKDGYITALAVGALFPNGEIKSWFFNITHKEGNVTSREEIIDILQQVCAEGVPLTGANLIYDLDWLEESYGVSLGRLCRLEDVQVAEPLIDENAKSYSLDKIGLKYLGEGKDDTDLYQYCAKTFGGKADRSQAKNFWRCPAWIIESYALSDVELPLQIHTHQKAELERQGLLGIWDVECRLQPVLLYMKRKGVRVDVDRTVALMNEFGEYFEQAMGELRQANGGVYVEVWAANSLAKLFDRHGLSYPRTATDRPSFTKQFLTSHRHPIAQLIVEARNYQKMRTTFLENAILGNEINGKIHCQFNQLRGDEYGTVTGRLSSSLPNLQQVPARSAAGKQVRALFIPEDGHTWAKLDYSQIEPRLLLSYADIRMVKKIVANYIQDPSLDCYNQMMMAMQHIDRPAVKSIYLGATYGMGKALMAQQLGCSIEDAEPQFDAFHDGAPYIKKLANLCSHRAETDGVIRTIGGRVRHFDLWEPRKFTKGAKGLPKDVALKEYEFIKRAYGYKALNCLMQGGAADIMKRAMVEAFEADLPLPSLTCHDEVDFSFEEDRTAIDEYARVMESQYADKLRVPMRVDVETGPSWGEVICIS